MDIVRASSSLPFVSPITYVDGVPMLDGGIADSIPVEYAMNQGYEKHVVSQFLHILKYKNNYET